SDVIKVQHKRYVATKGTKSTNAFSCGFGASLWLTQFFFFFAANFEAALRTAFAVAAFHDGHFNNFGDESLGESTNFRMNSNSSSERTATSYDHDLVIMQLDFSRATDRLENLQRNLHTIFQADIFSG